jgi:RNA polymerase primary sigma factor
MMATAAVIGLNTGKRLLSSSFYYSDLTEKLSNVNDHGITCYPTTTTKNVIVAKKSSNYGPSFPSSNRNSHSIKALKEHVDTASASSNAATWFKTFDDFEEESSALDYSVEALLLLQKSMLEKQWNLSFERTNSSDSTSKKNNKKIPVTCSGVSARQRRVNNRRKNQNQSKFMPQSSDFKFLRSVTSPDLLQNRLKGYVKGVVSDEVLPHTEVVRLSRIIRAGLSFEDHKSRLEYNNNDKRSLAVQCSCLFAHLGDSMISISTAFFSSKILKVTKADIIEGYGVDSKKFFFPYHFHLASCSQNLGQFYVKRNHDLISLMC